jgi:hypothetical protein
MVCLRNICINTLHKGDSDDDDDDDDNNNNNNKKVKQSHYRLGEALRVPEVEVPRLQDNRYMKVVRLSPLRTGRLYTPGNIPGIHSSVGIATRYGMDGSEVESRWGARFSAPVQTGPGAYPAPYTMGTGSFPGVKRPERGVDHQSPSSAEVKERAELYLYTLRRPSWPVLGRTLAFL